MYKVMNTRESFNTVFLEDALSNACASIAVARGGILTGFSLNGVEMIYLDEETFCSTDNNVRGGCPILFPICGRLADKKYSIDGKTYSMEIHGLARKLPWRVLRTKTDTAAELTIELCSSDATKAQYPFDFRLEYTYILKDGKLTIRQAAYNTSEDLTMPVSYGLHPYFKVDRTKARVYISAGGDIIAGECREVFDGGSSFNGPADYIVEKNGDKPPILDTGLGYSITLACSDTYKYYVVWSPEDAEFVCVEPWTALPNALNTKESLIYLAPGAGSVAETEITVIK